MACFEMEAENKQKDRCHASNVAMVGLVVVIAVFFHAESLRKRFEQAKNETIACHLQIKQTREELANIRILEDCIRICGYGSIDLDAGSVDNVEPDPKQDTVNDDERISVCDDKRHRMPPGEIGIPVFAGANNHDPEKVNFFINGCDTAIDNVCPYVVCHNGVCRHCDRSRCLWSLETTGKVLTELEEVSQHDKM